MNNTPIHIPSTIATLVFALALVLLAAPRPLAAQEPDAVPLFPGCNAVALTWLDATPTTEIVAAITPPSALEGIWRLNNQRQTFDGFSPHSIEGSDLVAVNGLDAVFICMRASGLLVRPPAILTGTTVAALPPAPPVAQDPAAALVGQVLMLCDSTTSFALRVEQAVWTTTIGGATADGMWVALLATATNTGTRTGNVYLAEQLRDERGRLFDIAAPDAPWLAVEREYGVADPVQNIQPGLSARVLLLFEVPADVRTLQLVPSGRCS